MSLNCPALWWILNWPSINGPWTSNVWHWVCILQQIYNNVYDLLQVTMWAWQRGLPVALTMCLIPLQRDLQWVHKKVSQLKYWWHFASPFLEVHHLRQEIVFQLPCKLLKWGKVTYVWELCWPLLAGSIMCLELYPDHCNPAAQKWMIQYIYVSMRVSYIKVIAIIHLLCYFPVSIWPTDPGAYTPESAKRSWSPAIPHILPIPAMYVQCVWTPPPLGGEMFELIFSGPGCLSSFCFVS